MCTQCLHVLLSTNSSWTALAEKKEVADVATGTIRSKQDIDSRGTTQIREIENPNPTRSASSASCAGNNTPHGYSDESPSPPLNGSNLLVIQAKHKLMVTLMQDVYAIFDEDWKVDPRTCTSTPSGSSGAQSSQTRSEAPSAYQKGKRRTQDRESSPPDNGNGNGKRGRKEESDKGPQRQARPYACPFHKYDPRKYSLNNEAGTAYRSCMGPGFSCISHLKYVQNPKIGIGPNADMVFVDNTSEGLTALPFSVRDAGLSCQVRKRCIRMLMMISDAKGASRNLKE